MERVNYSSKQSPGGNSSISFSWDKKQPDPSPSVPAQDTSDFHSKLAKILQGEQRRKQLEKKEVKTSVKVNKPPGGSNNFFF